MNYAKTLAVTTLAIGALAFTGCSGTKTGTNLGRAIDGTMYNESSWYNNDGYNTEGKYGNGTIGDDGVWYNNSLYGNYNSGTVTDGYGTGYYGNDDYYAGVSDDNGWISPGTHNNGYYYNSYGQRFSYGSDGILRNSYGNTANGYNYNLGTAKDIITDGKTYSGLYSNSLVEAR